MCCTVKRTSPLSQSSILCTALDVIHPLYRIQEVINEDLREAGRIPRTMEVELTADLVDCCCPGDMVTITAIVKATGSDEGHGGRSSKDRCTFLLYLHAISVSNDKLLAGGDSSPASIHVEFSTKDYYAIEEIHGDRDVFKLIVGSLCPGIYGHEIVKAGLVLGLFGGSQDSNCTKNAVPVRGDPHILIVGDPGMGKSQMLQAAANTAPRGVYVCGNTSTAAGLTVTVTRDSSSNDYSLDAGALVLADQGCCCIDEFDKMGNQHQALLEAMEQQTISIAKAGIICSLPARTSILAAANLAGGHYNKAKTVSENLKMGSALLSRFDLVFILLDRPDEELDCLLSRHVMSLHSAPSASTSHSSSQVTSVTVRRNSSISITSSQSSVLWSADDIPLSERLKVLPSEGFDPVPNQLLRKYVAYARKYVKPSLSPEAAEVIQKFYLKLRQQRQGIDCTPITTRQLESLIRLTEARARLELRETATSRDAQDVVEIFKYSLYDAYSNEMGVVDFSRSQNGSGMASQSQVKRFVAELNKIAESTFNCLFTTQQMKDISKRMGIRVACFEDFIGSLNCHGYLLKKGAKTYQLQTFS
ncbi:DNA helicase MCM8-like [Dysidea avara]|uniref:DNA helicase MCM8-like n=1 Tax=Dysidea avara TaxID=196820 RepID=UPI00331EBE9C